MKRVLHFKHDSKKLNGIVKVPCHCTEEEDKHFSNTVKKNTKDLLTYAFYNPFMEDNISKI